MRWTPDELASHASGTLARAGSAEIRGAFIDSRSPLSGGVFVPLVAARDGHAFIPSALAGGAAAVLVAGDREIPSGDLSVVRVDDTLESLTRLARRRRDLFEGPVISISGSNGKTTTRSMIGAVMGTTHDPVLATRGNLNNHLGVPLTLLGEPHEPAAMVIEFGMNAPGENDHLASIVRPHVHVVTSVAIEHLEFMGTLEAIAEAEAEPLRYVPEGGMIVLPHGVRELAVHVPSDARAEVWTCGTGVDADVRVVEVVQEDRTRARLSVRGGPPVEVALQSFGAHNALNAAYALAVGCRYGVPLSAAVGALEAVAPVGDRGRLLRWGPHRIIADCYNANPGSVEVALRSLVAVRERCTGPLVAVLGDMLELGPLGPRLHAEVGRLAADLGVDRVIGVGPLSRATVEAASAGGIEAVHVGEDIELAASRVARALGDAPGVVLVKASRGLRLERVVEALRQRPPYA